MGFFFWLERASLCVKIIIPESKGMNRKPDGRRALNFTHLHVHTEYSLLDGSNKIKEYVQRVKELGMDSAAITDHGVMYGVIDFYRAAKEAGIHPVLGCEVYVAPGSRFDRERKESEERYYHLVLLAENNTGYANLMKIVSRGFTEGFYYRPRVDLDLLREYHEGIIALSACLAGAVPSYLERGMYEEAKEEALKYRDIFGEGNYFLELQDHGIAEQKLVNQQLVRMSHELNIPLVATNDVHYTYEEDADAHDILLCLQTGKKLSDENRLRFEGDQYFVKSPEQMEELFSYVPVALENTHEIAMRCQVEIEFGVTKLPHYDVPSPYTSWDYLNKLCEDGLKKRYGQKAEEVRPRLEYELSVIRKMGYVDYFLIVWDFIHFAREQGIPVGPGRGSAAGSVVAYTLEITQLDPIKYNLLFERFLNPERVSMPDIDVDFSDERRQEVIDYVMRKYGQDHVVQIITFGTMAARGVIRDVGRVMDLPYSLCDSIAKLVPKELDITLEKSLEQSRELREMYESDEQVHRLIDMSRRLEGLPRNTSMHAAGVVISQKRMDEYVPLSRAADGTITTQFTMTTIEELGLLKMDFLGLRTLSVIQNAVRLVKESSGKEIDIDALDFDDKEVFYSLSTGKTDGVFQLESAGMKNFMKELKPESFEDIIAGIALYRPGPMNFIPKYIYGKNNPDDIVYDCPQLVPILQPTYGCIVYQEQVMQIVRELGGYSMGRSDLVRRAMSKKKADVMAKERQNFVYGNEKEEVPGCIKNGIDESTANKIFDEMTDFAQYAFNKSHAAAYAVVAYQTAWLKYYYPVEYMAALMTSVIDNPAKVAEYTLTCRRMGIQILPPDINTGESAFSVKDGSILYALSAIKSVGRSVIDGIVDERNQNGLFKSLQDFITRMSDSREVNKRTIEGLIKAGAMDSLGATRRQMLMTYEKIIDQVATEKKDSVSGQISLFDLMGEEEKQDYEIRFPDVGEFDKEELLAFEKEVLGIYVSGHPLEQYEEKWRETISNVTADFQLNEETNQPVVQDNERALIGGMITEITVKYTKNNQTMAFVTIEDLVGTAEVIVFPKDYEKYRSLLTSDNKVFIRGRVSAEDDKPSRLICERMWPFDEKDDTSESVDRARTAHGGAAYERREPVPSGARELWVQFADRREYDEKESQLFDILRKSEGEDYVVLYVRSERSMRELGENWTICANDDLLGKLRDVFGEGNVRFAKK